MPTRPHKEEQNTDALRGYLGCDETGDVEDASECGDREKGGQASGTRVSDSRRHQIANFHEVAAGGVTVASPSNTALKWATGA